jgi:hypothetical protein
MDNEPNVVTSPFDAIRHLDGEREFVFRATSNDELPDTAGLLDGPDSIKRRWERIVGLPLGSGPRRCPA